MSEWQQQLKPFCKIFWFTEYRDKMWDKMACFKISSMEVPSSSKWLDKTPIGVEEDNNNNTKDILINGAAEDAVILKAKVSHNRVRLVNKVLCSEKKSSVKIVTKLSGARQLWPTTKNQPTLKSRELKLQNKNYQKWNDQI